MKKWLTIWICLLMPLIASAQIGLGVNRNKGSLLSGSTSFDYGKPKEFIIGGISVTGAEYLDHNALISMTGLKVGDKVVIPSENLSSVIRKLWKQGLLGDIQLNAERIEGDKVFLQLVLSERPRLSKFIFEGISKGQISSLSEKIKLIKGRIVNDVTLKNTETTIRQFYYDKGFRNVEVNMVQKKDTLLSNSVQLHIKINKGVKVRIKEIQFEGVAQVKESKLRRKMKKTKQKSINFLAHTKFISKEYKKDKESLIEYYNKLGFRDAVITWDTVKVIDKENLAINIKIEEGKKYYYRNITWEGNYLYKSEQLGRVLGIKKGDVYNPDDLSKRLNFNPTGTDITSLYMDDGYLFFSVTPVEASVENDSIDIVMRIHEGDQATINKVYITGNTRTNEHVVMREIRTMPGEKFSRSDLIRTQRELATLGYFDPEQIGINPKPNMNDGTVDIHYSVAEKPSDQVELSGGWAAYGFIGTLGLVFNNFSARKITKFSEWSPLPQGDGQKLSVRMQATGRAYQSYMLSFAEPWLGGKKPNNFSIAVQHSIQRAQSRSNLVNGSAFSWANAGKLKISSISFSLGRRLQFPDDFFVLNNSISLMRYDLEDFGGGSFRQISTGVFNSLIFNTTISRNNIDNPIYPRSGSSISLSVSLTPPYSAFSPHKNYEVMTDVERFKWVEYHKWMFDNTWYLQLAGKLVFSGRAHLGFLGNYNKSIGTSPFERFVMGGSGMGFGQMILGQDIIGLRGYPNESVRPNSSPGSFNERREGGVVYNKFVAEIRYPITLAQAASIYVLAFAEAGNNWGSIKDYNPFDLKRSYGFGARIFMPAFGLLGVDYGFTIDDTPGFTKTSKGQFHFTIGQMIR